MLDVIDETAKDEFVMMEKMVQNMAASPNPDTQNMAAFLRSFCVLFERLVQRDMERCTCIPEEREVGKLIIDIECPWHGKH